IRNRGIGAATCEPNRSSNKSLASAVPRLRAQTSASSRQPFRTHRPARALPTCVNVVLPEPAKVRSCLASEDALAGPQPPRSLAGPTLRQSARGKGRYRELLGGHAHGG